MPNYVNIAWEKAFAPVLFNNSFYLLKNNRKYKKCCRTFWCGSLARWRGSKQRTEVFEARKYWALLAWDYMIK